MADATPGHTKGNAVEPFTPELKPGAYVWRPAVLFCRRDIGRRSAGKLKFSDPVSKYVAGVPNGDHITIAELLDMRSGLYNYLNAPELSKSADHDPTRVWTPAELLAIGFAQPSNFPPDTDYEYSNTNYVLLGLIVEKVDRKSLAQSMQDRLFRPPGMLHTALPPINATALLAPYSHGYLYGSSSVAFVGKPPYSAAVKAAATAGTLKPNDYTSLNHSFAWAAGGAISNADDLATWIQALVSGRVFDAKHQQLWLDSLRPMDPKKPGQEYGYGIIALRWGTNAIYNHGGETAGYQSFMGYDPANKITLIVWTNLTVSLDEIPTANALMLKVLDQVYVELPVFDKRRPQRRPQRLLEEPPNVTRKMRGLDSGANARSDDREALGFSTLLERSCRQRRSAQDGRQLRNLRFSFSFKRI